MYNADETINKVYSPMLITFIIHGENNVETFIYIINDTRKPFKWLLVIKKIQHLDYVYKEMI